MGVGAAQEVLSAQGSRTCSRPPSASSYVKENRILEEDGASLLLSNNASRGLRLLRLRHAPRTGRMFNIAPRWSFGADSAAGAA